MKEFVRLTSRPYPTKTGWKVGQLSKAVLRQVIGSNEVVAQGIEYALERQWIVEKAPGTDIYCPTETGFKECWDS